MDNPLKLTSKKQELLLTAGNDFIDLKFDSSQKIPTANLQIIYTYHKSLLSFKNETDTLHKK